jgi:hypothetical protein
MRNRLSFALLAVLSTAPALARSLPKSESSPAARPCPEMGEGFVRLAGSDTCVKLAGSVRVEVMKQSGGGSAAGDR